LVQEGAPATAKSNNEIPLSHKRRPIYQVNSDKLDLYESYWTTRGQVDISKLVNLVREGYNLKYATNSHKKHGCQKNKHFQNIQLSPKKASKMTAWEDAAKPRFAEKDISSNTNLWDPINAAVHNISICRPSHDAWGIYKIVLLFCDDFVQRRYALPWWHR
jgi:hypothetical protein